MLKIIKPFLLTVLAVCLLFAAPATAQGIKGNLVSVDWLEKNLKNPDVLVLDASNTKNYLAKHVPGAVSVSFTKEESVSQGVNLSYGGGVDYFTDMETCPYAFQEMPVPQMEKLFQSWGVSPNLKIVVYDEGGIFHAARLFYSLYYHGFPVKNLYILDGGLAKWQEEGLPITKDIPAAPKKGTFKIKKLNENIHARLPEFLTATGDRDKNAILEGLPPVWHFGQALNYDKPGHIPFAIMLGFPDFFNKDKTYKSREEIQRMLDYLGIRRDQQVYTHCGGGPGGSVPFFALKFIVQYPKVKHFPESQLAWLYDQRDLPFWTYDAPYLMRSTNWLQWWGSQRTRSLGSIHVSIVDVRSADAYTQGHVPFALNIPADTFRNHLKDPAALARILGPAGVNPAHEAVVVSGAGITKESALAYLLLEQLGQKKVSVFMDTMEYWSKRGYALKKDATIVAEKKVRHDLAVPPVDYRATLGKVVITDPKSTKGLYPKVFIASGKTVPAQAVEGKVVHVPYTELLNDDGSPKPAKDIWNIIAKAGVPRYAELVCFSDDPGEAAVNYFIMRLMGFPDVKVLVF